MNTPSTEVLGLTAAALLGLVHIVLASHSASVERGYHWSAGPRDEPLPPLTSVAGRFARANANYLETFPFFAAGVLAVIATGTHSVWSNWESYSTSAGASLTCRSTPPASSLFAP